ncbi:C-C motif chemokine 20-like [Acanthochromis polyacanthus]|uniref:C-C motif chemokine n=1 Tax=Acanthochromis polyacanthus TaxID=80966 RepID=A0A3Q1GYG0_9TELE|nr:C-C motif chemokine 20-like [Acanthochromis polyacanthus]
MAPTAILPVTAVLLCFMLGIFSPAPAALGARRPSCCTKYSKNPLDVQEIRGYREQSDTGVCRIKAIIFFTASRTKVCADPEAPWVKEALKFLSSKLKKMSKTGPAASGTPKSESDSFYNETEPFLNDTDIFGL